MKNEFEEKEYSIEPSTKKLKTETIEEFLKRGGKIKKLPTPKLEIIIKKKKERLPFKDLS